jgi:tRNA nucleotidyltransferase/poly(A) polymerase
MPDGTEKGADHEDVGAELVEAFMNRLKYPKARTERVKTIVANHMFPYFNNEKGARKFLNNLGGNVQMAEDLLRLRMSDASGKRTGEMEEFDANAIQKATDLLRTVIENNSAVSIRDLAITGKDLIDAGMKPGPNMGVVLNKMLELVIENPELNNRDDLMAILNDGLATQ